MKTKHILLMPILALSLNSSSIAQQIHPAFEKTASKINTAGEHVTMTKMDGDIGALTQYLDLILKTAKNSGEKVPEMLKAKDLISMLGIDSIKAVGASAQELDNAWVNHCYLENGGSSKGIFSLFGKTNQEFIAPNICPAGTDLALQVQLDLREVSAMVTEFAKLAGEEKILKDMEKNIPDLEMTPNELLSKLNVTVSIGLDINTDENAQTNPMALISGANMIARIDGLNWLWDKLGDQILAESKVPMDKSEKNGLIIYTIPDQMRKDLLGYSPQLIIDNANQHIWISSKPEFFEKCKAGENKLVDSPEFKDAFEKLPGKGNSMMYVSKGFLRTAKSQYDSAAKTGMFGKDFQAAKELVDYLMVDMTESDKGWAMVLSKDEDGLMFASRGPIGIHHLSYLSPAILMGANYMTIESIEMHQEIEEMPVK